MISTLDAVFTPTKKGCNKTNGAPKYCKRNNKLFTIKTYKKQTVSGTNHK